jgi:hypothetical protein
MRTAVALRGRGLVFVAFDLMFLNDEDLRALPIEERRAELRRLIPRSPKSRLQFSEAIAGAGAEGFASAERLGLEGIVSKRVGSHYRSGRVDTWRKVKCWAESALILIGTDVDKRSGAPVALLARQGEEGLQLVAEPSSPSETLSRAPYALGWIVSASTAHPSRHTDGVDRDNLTIDHRRSTPELAGSFDDRPISVRPVEPVAGERLRCAVRDDLDRCRKSLQGGGGCKACRSRDSSWPRPPRGTYGLF